MPEPNVIDMIFGRIDRNTDTDFRDRDLAQRNEQFLTQADIDRVRMIEAQRQFNASLKLNTEQFTQLKGQQSFINDTAINEAISKGVFSPTPGASSPLQSTQPSTPTPTNMFMQGGMFPETQSAPMPTAPGTVGPGFNYKGQQIFPVNQETARRQQAAYEFGIKRQQMGEEEAHLIKQGLPPMAAAMAARGHTQLAASIYGNPKNFLAVALQSGVPQHIINKYIQSMGQLEQAGTPPEQRTAWNAQAASGFSNARQNNLQSDALVKSQQNAPQASQLWTEAMKEMIASGHGSSSDPTFAPMFYSTIDKKAREMNVSPEVYNLVIQAAQKQLVDNRTLGQTNFLGELLRGVGNQNQTGGTSVNVPITPGDTPPASNKNGTPVGSQPNNERSPALEFTQPRAATPLPSILQEMLNQYNQRRINQQFQDSTLR